jgi:hypothetical protein
VLYLAWRASMGRQTLFELLNFVGLPHHAWSRSHQLDTTLRQLIATPTVIVELP